MREPEYKWWQVLMCVVGFLLIMGLAGGEDMRAAQMADQDRVHFAQDGRP